VTNTSDYVLYGPLGGEWAIEHDIPFGNPCLVLFDPTEVASVEPANASIETVRTNSTRSISVFRWPLRNAHRVRLTGRSSIPGPLWPDCAVMYHGQANCSVWSCPVIAQPASGRVAPGGGGAAEVVTLYTVLGLVAVAALMGAA
jgi:hypothetical protein